MAGRINLREMVRHSRMCEIVDVGGMFDLKIMPWAPIQLDAIRPVLSRLLKALEERDKDQTVMSGIATLMDDPQYFKDIVHVVYVSLERGNTEIAIKGTSDVAPLFSEEEMSLEFPVPALIDIVSAIWRVNFEKNLSRGSILGIMKENAAQAALEVVSQ